MLLILADAGVSLTDAMPAISAVGSLGFAIWFAWYTTTTTIPNQQKEHREAIDRLTMTHSETIKEIVTEMRSQRDAYEKWRMSAR